METHEITLTAKELQALAEGTALTAPLGDNRRLVLSVALPREEETEEAESAPEPDGPTEISEGVEVDE
jgi:hypothetical protein